MIFKRFLKGVNWFTDIWIALALAMMLMVILLDIALRETFNAPLTWHLELSQYCLINVTYIGAAVAHRRKEHISINLFTAMLPAAKERAVNLLGKFIVLPFLLILAYSCFDILLKGQGVTPCLRLPKWTYYLPIFVGSVCLILHAVNAIVEDIQAMRSVRQGEPPLPVRR